MGWARPDSLLCLLAPLLGFVLDWPFATPGYNSVKTGLCSSGFTWPSIEHLPVEWPICIRLHVASSHVPTSFLGFKSDRQHKVPDEAEVVTIYLAVGQCSSRNYR